MTVLWSSASRPRLLSRFKAAFAGIARALPPALVCGVTPELCRRERAASPELTQSLLRLVGSAPPCRPARHRARFAGGRGGSPASTGSRLSAGEVAERNHTVHPHPALAVWQRVSRDLRGSLVLRPAAPLCALRCCREPRGAVRGSGCSGKVCFPRYTDAALVLSVLTRNSLPSCTNNVFPVASPDAEVFLAGQRSSL